MHRPHGPSYCRLPARSGLKRRSVFLKLSSLQEALQKRATQVKVHSLVACNTASYKNLRTLSP